MKVRLVREATYYSVSSIVWRLFNVLMLPLFTAVMPPDNGAYGLMTNLYGWGSIMTIILSMGLETAFMRVASSDEEKANPARVYSTAFLFIIAIVTCFLLIGLKAAPFLSTLIGYPTHYSEIRLMSFIIAGDTLLILPFCYLRYRRNAKKYAICKALYAVINAFICFCVLFLCPRLQQRWPQGILWEFYIPNNELNYVLGCNLVTCVIMLYILIEEWKPFGHFHSAWNRVYPFRYEFDTKIFVHMMRYALPIMGASLIDVAIQNLDRIMYPWLVPGEEGIAQLGIYGACFRIGMIMALATQVLRDIAEPTLFRLSNSRRAVETTGAVLIKFFLICSVVILLGVETVTGFIQRYLLSDQEYWSGMTVVPILMCSEMLVGIQFYMSFWYKLTDRPSYGTWFALASLAVIFIINVIFVPIFGYIACAWAIFFGCLMRLALTFLVSRFKSQYRFQFSGSRYVYLGLAIYASMRICPNLGQGWTFLFKAGCTLTYLLLVYWLEKKQLRLAFIKLKQNRRRLRQATPTMVTC